MVGPGSSSVVRRTRTSPLGTSTRSNGGGAVMESGANRFGVGLLGHGTVGAAFAGLLPRRAERIERLTGLRPELAGILTRSTGSFGDLLERPELIVELIGGVDPARGGVP